MNRRQKLVQQEFLDKEEIVIKRLKNVYDQGLKDLNANISNLQFTINGLQATYDWLADGDPKKEVVKSMIQSKIYQKQYQEALKKQISGVLNEMQVKQFTTISDYLDGCYSDGFIGTVFDLHGQGIPLIMPINQQSMVRAVQLDSKISHGLYTRLGEDIDLLKRKILGQVSRSIATGTSYSDTAQYLAGYTKIGYNNAIRITRTEGHRIQTTAAMDALESAKDKGCDVVKQWDSTLDKRTRESHQHVDGEIRELDEPFSNGLMYPGDPDGGAAEVVNCRCALLQRAKWALDDDELEQLKERAAYFGLDKSKNYEDFKNKYLKSVESPAKISVENVLNKPVTSTDKNYQELLVDLDSKGIDYNPIHNHKKPVSNDDIIKALCGGDRTSGSCASVGLAYVGQRQGWNVLDFRDGDSRKFFSNGMNLFKLSQAKGLKTLKANGASSITVGNRLLKQCEAGKEYYLCVGRHASIVRKTEDGVLQYLELQSATKSGWTDFDGNPRYTLKWRFGCSSSSSGSSLWDFMIDIEESDFDTDEFKSILGYINTAEDKQVKGVTGSVK